MSIFFNSASDWTKEHFGKRIQKVPIDGGFSCPNRDGKLSNIGCLYCNNKTFTPFYTNEKKSIKEQLQTGIDFFSKRYNCENFFAYFQTYSGTYAPIEILEKKYQEALNIATAIKTVYKLLGLFNQNPEIFINEIKIKFLKDNNIDEEYIDTLILKRQELKSLKNYKEADKIRDLLLEKNIIISDTRDGTFWDIK